MNHHLPFPADTPTDRRPRPPGGRVRRQAVVLVVGAVLTSVAAGLGPRTAASATPVPADGLTSSEIANGTGEQSSPRGGARGTIGVASFNSWAHLSRRQARRDAHALAERPGLDVIGWQEANHNPPGRLGLASRGWATAQPEKPNGNPHELAVSWRAAEFDLVDSTVYRMHGRLDRDAGDNRSFPKRWVLRVTLRRTGPHPDLVTVLDTHVNQHTERWATRPGHPYRNLNADKARVHLGKLQSLLGDTASRYTVAVGDFNWDYRADQEVRARGFVADRIGSVAISSWESLGTAHQPATHPFSHRKIDYVFLARGPESAFRRQKVITGLHSDHRPLLARIALG